jgi:glycosyltransferase involved in cell wall biosynthesis
MKPCGISFIVRARNEEKNLEKCVRSLFTLTIPYEINIILNSCTDRSEEIAKKLAEENFSSSNGLVE